MTFSSLHFLMKLLVMSPITALVICHHTKEHALERLSVLAGRESPRGVESRGVTTWAVEYLNNNRIFPPHTSTLPYLLPPSRSINHHTPAIQHNPPFYNKPHYHQATELPPGRQNVSITNPRPDGQNLSRSRGHTFTPTERRVEQSVPQQRATPLKMVGL